MSDNPKQEAEKLATSAETGDGRTMARPGGAGGMGAGLESSDRRATGPTSGGDMGAPSDTGGTTGDPGAWSGNASGMSGAETNDAQPGGAAAGDQSSRGG